MARHFDNELRDLKFSLLAMAGQVEEMVALTHVSLMERSDSKANQVCLLDKGVDELELRLDQACIDLLALRAPFASDLRLIASTLKIVPELERIGDHCSNIARRALILNPLPPLLLGDGFRMLGERTQTMVKQAVDAFVNGDADLAKTVIESDDHVDRLYTDLNRELLKVMLADPRTIERASHYINILKNWERIADQATNIAEEVLFIIGGVSVKHPYLQAPPED